MIYGKSKNFKDPELANSEVSEQTKRSRNFANSLSRDVFESPICNSTSVRVERVKPALGASFSFFFRRCRLPRLKKSLVLQR